MKVKLEEVERYERPMTMRLAFRFGDPELLRSAHDFLQRLKLVALLRDKQFRIADDVDEQDVTYLELQF